MKLYLSSYEYDDFESPKEILQYRKTIIDDRNVMVVEVDKPLIGQKYGYGGKDIHRFYLLNRVDEDAFEKLNHFPIDVHVLVPKNLENKNPSSLSELKNIAWACLYNNKEDARNHKVV